MAETAVPSFSAAGWRHRALAAAAILAFVPVAMWWLQRAADAPANGWFAGTTTFRVGDDFAVFHTAGVLVAEERSSSLYDPEEFWESYRNQTGRELQFYSSFAHPPPFAAVMAAFSGLPWQTAYLIWTIAGLAAMAAALALLGARRAVALAAASLLSFPVYIVVTGGQASFFWLLILAGVYWSLSQGRRGIAGGLAGLLILKPSLMLGMLLWFLIDRQRRAALTALLSAAALTAATLPLVGQVWLDYPGAVAEFAGRHRAGGHGRLAQFSPFGFFDLLPINTFPLAVAGGVILASVGGLAFVAFHRRHRDDWELMFAAAVVLTLWISPHLVAADWTLLIVPGLVLWRVRPLHRATWLATGLILASASMLSVVVTGFMVVNVGWGLPLAVPSLGLAAWWVARTLAPPVAAGAHPSVSLQGSNGPGIW